jgi:UDP-N-acetylglucosamine 3-dehydrogenase
MASRKLRVAMIGTGNFAPCFAPFVAEVAEIVAICDPHAKGRAHFAEVTGWKLPEFSDVEQLYAEADFDAVVLTGPNFTHKPYTLQAANAGKHVFCEKAMAPSVKDCWEMVNACEAAKVKLMVGQKRRLRPPWARMIQLREQLGPVVAVTVMGYMDSRPDDFRGWWVREADSGGVLTLSGVHEIDWLRAMCGDVEAVSAVNGPQIDPRFDFSDTIHLSLRFRNRAVGFLGVSLSYPLLRYRQVVGAEVVCAKGGARLVSSFHEVNLHWKRLDDTFEQHERFEEPNGNPVGSSEALRKEFHDFVRWIEDGTAPCLTWREGLRAVEVIEAARRSAQQNGNWMNLPLYPELEPKTTS